MTSRITTTNKVGLYTGVVNYINNDKENWLHREKITFVNLLLCLILYISQRTLKKFVSPNLSNNFLCTLIGDICELTYENLLARRCNPVVPAPLPFPPRSNRYFRCQRPPNWPRDSIPISESVGMPRECASDPSNGWARELDCYAFPRGPRPLRQRHRPLWFPFALDWRHLAVTSHRRSQPDFANSPCWCGRAAKGV